jgi:glycine/D-amino acid oxidase-like deaminating enzyme
MATSTNQNVVICGGGIMGASTAYHLALRGINATVIERSEIGAAASGKAGGFLVRALLHASSK